MQVRKQRLESPFQEMTVAAELGQRAYDELLTEDVNPFATIIWRAYDALDGKATLVSK